MAIALAELGDFSAATGAGEEALRLSKQHDTAYGLFHGCMGLGAALLMKGDVQPALSSLLRSRAVAEATDLPVMLNAGLTFVGYVYLQADDLREAAPRSRGRGRIPSQSDSWPLIPSA
jgi:hypothetical protein